MTILQASNGKARDGKVLRLSMCEKCFTFIFFWSPLQGMTMSERRNKLGKSFINYIVSTCDVVADDDDDGGGT